MRAALRAGLLGLATLLANPALAHGDGDRDRGEHGQRGPVTVPDGVHVPSWNELSPAQQEKLSPLREHWDALPASRRVHALERMERRARWEAMTPGQREKLRQGARNFRELPTELREKMRASMLAMRDLPDDERRRLRELWHGLSPEQRRAWLQAGGPGLSPPPAQP